jgi:hypothetical protein
MVLDLCTGTADLLASVFATSKTSNGHAVRSFECSVPVAGSLFWNSRCPVRRC